MIDKIPPQAIDVEELILGAILLDQQAIPVAMNILKEDSFYKPSHALIFAACQKLYNERKPTDILTIKTELKERGELESVGGAFYITQLTNRVASAAHIEYHCRIVEQAAIARRLITVCTQAIADVYENPVDIFEHLEQLNIKLSKGDISVVGNDTSPANRMNQAINHIQQAMAGLPTGVSSGYKELDKLTGGWQNGDLIIIASRPGMGKSAIAISMAHNAVKHTAIYMHQMEMTASQVGIRELAMATGIRIQALKTGNVFPDEMERVREAAAAISKTKFTMDFESGQNMYAVQSKIIKAKKENNIGLALIDYLGLITPPKAEKGKSTNTSYEIGMITSGMKRLAKELNIPIIMFCQLNRAVESRTGNKPQLSDLRDSGAIEQDADIVVFLLRPDYYTHAPTNEIGESLAGKIDLIIAKNRQGATGDVWLNHDLSTNLITGNGA